MARTFSSGESRDMIKIHQTLLHNVHRVSRECQIAQDDLDILLENDNIHYFFRKYGKKELRTGEDIHDYPELNELFEKYDRYLRLRPVKQECDDLSGYENQIKQNMEDLSPANKVLSWLFASKETKKKAQKAYDELQDLLEGDYRNRILELDSIIKKLPSLPLTEQEFRHQLMDYANEHFEHLRMEDPEVDRLLKKNQSLVYEYDELTSQLADNREKIRDEIMQRVNREVMEILRTIPVESLKTGDAIIRIKPLRDNGYETVADIHEAGIYALSDISGISLETARLLKQKAGQYAADTQKTIHIKLNADYRTEEFDQLIRDLYAYKQRLAWMDDSRKIMSSYKELPYAMEALQLYQFNPYWILLDPIDKKKTSDAYQYALETLDSNYYDDLHAIYEEPLKNPFNAWDDFEKDAIYYYAMLEEIVPGAVDDGDSLYGLPEDLANQIREETIFPNGLLCTLRHYQEWGVKYILHQHNVLLGDEMGLGKTVQAIAAMVSLKNIGADHFVVVCPAGVLPNWCKEIAKHSKLSYVSVYGPHRDEALQYWKDYGGVAVTTYETTKFWTLEEDFTYSLLVVDEAHYIKNPAAKRTIHVKAMAKHANRILLMTGTALENRVEEMISLLSILQPELAEKAERVSYLSQAEQFRELVAPVYYRRKREDVLMELPELIENQEWCTLLDEEKRIYRRDIFNHRYMDCRQVSWNVEDLNNSSKARRLLELIEEAKEDGRKILVFSFFRKTLEKIKNYLGDEISTPIINGSVPAKTRQDIIDDFEKAPPGHVLISQIQAGGTGLNIQSASVVIICEPQLKPSIENQAISRAYRMGQSRNVLVHRLLCENTIDERITDLLEDKQYIFDQFAHESVAADADQITAKEIDHTTFYRIVEEEIERIKKEMEQNR